MKKGIYKLSFDCGRMGELNGVFVDTDIRVAKLIESGVDVYFGEVLGKHSEIFGPIEQRDIKLVTEDETTVKAFEENNLENGFNPFDYTHIGFEKEGVDTDDMLISDVIDLLLQE